MSATPAVDAVIFRYTDPTDDIQSGSFTDKIEFNAGTVPDSTGRLTFPSYSMRRDTNIHPNPRRALDQIQDSLLGIVDVHLAGYFVKHYATLGPRTIWKWQVDPAVNNNFPFGRFGLILKSFDQVLELIPTTESGYILYDAEVQDNENPRDEVPFTCKLYRNGTITNDPSKIP